MDWIRKLLQHRDNWSERTPATSSSHFERLEPRVVLSADFLPGLMDQDFGDLPERLDGSSDLQPLVSFLSSLLEKQTIKDSFFTLRPGYQQLIDTVQSSPDGAVYSGRQCKQPKPELHSLQAIIESRVQ
ncbi:MAG: LEPR-XLL domain-containing protein [bacterium]|nr:LEPR-XLL domain-containing protein [Gammaproteobacteria bacterium]HIL95829.1 LEPR-XLL domain-containing protein [Pseudomonadales bacterium]